MCINCVSNGEFAAINVALATGAVSHAVRNVASFRSREERRLVRDARTVAFLRQLALDPVTVLGAETVAGAAAAGVETPSVRERARYLYAAVCWAVGAIRSQSLPSPQ